MIYLQRFTFTLFCRYFTLFDDYFLPKSSVVNKLPASPRRPPRPAQAGAPGAWRAEARRAGGKHRSSSRRAERAERARGRTGRTRIRDADGRARLSSAGPETTRNREHKRRRCDTALPREILSRAARRCGAVTCRVRGGRSWSERNSASDQSSLPPGGRSSGQAALQYKTADAQLSTAAT
jgi:hypothetical protein